MAEWLTIQDPKTKATYAVTPADYRRKKLGEEQKTYEELGYKVIGTDDGSTWPPPDAKPRGQDKDDKD